MATAKGEGGSTFGSAGSAAPEVAPTDAGVLSLNTSKPPEAGENASGWESEGRKQRRKLLATLVFIMACVVGQSYAAAGLQAVLELYFVTFLYICLRKDRASSLATTTVNVYIAIYQLCALSGGFLADKVIGNFLTQNISNIITTVGICLMTFASWQYALEEPSCCCDHGNSYVDPTDPTSHLLGDTHCTSNCSELHKYTLLESPRLHISPGLNMFLAIAGLVLFALGYGQAQAIQTVFVADQFNEGQSTAKKRSFSWYYLFCNLGNLLGEGGMPVLRQSIGFIISLLTVVAASFSSTVLFMAGYCFYVRKKPERIECTCCKTKMDEETQPLLTDGDSSGQSKETAVPLLTKLKQLLPILGVFSPLIIFWAIFFQQSTTWVLQARQMDCYFGKLHVPPDIMPSVNDLLVIAIIPLLDYLVYPHLERKVVRVTPLRKFVVGMVCAALSFLMSGLLQLYLHDPATACHGDVNIAWQLPQLLLISFAEVLVAVTGLEFAYSQAPQDFRNIVTALWTISQALGTLLNAGIAEIQMSLKYEFFLYLVLISIVTIVFVLVNRNYQYRTSQVTNVRARNDAYKQVDLCT